MIFVFAVDNFLIYKGKVVHYSELFLNWHRTPDFGRIFIRPHKNSGHYIIFYAIIGLMRWIYLEHFVSVGGVPFLAVLHGSLQTQIHCSFSMWTFGQIHLSRLGCSFSLQCPFHDKAAVFGAGRIAISLNGIKKEIANRFVL